MEMDNNVVWHDARIELPKTNQYETDFLVHCKVSRYDTTIHASRLVDTTMIMSWQNTTVRGKEVSRWLWRDNVNFPWEVLHWAELPMYKEE